MGYEVIVSCPAGNAAALLEDGATFHHTFNARVKKTLIEMIEELKKCIFNENATIIIIDEISMTPC